MNDEIRQIIADSKQDEVFLPGLSRAQVMAWNEGKPLSQQLFVVSPENSDQEVFAFYKSTSSAIKILNRHVHASIVCLYVKYPDGLRVILKRNSTDGVFELPKKFADFLDIKGVEVLHQKMAQSVLKQLQCEHLVTLFEGMNVDTETTIMNYPVTCETVVFYSKIDVANLTTADFQSLHQNCFTFSLEIKPQACSTIKEWMANKPSCIEFITWMIIYCGHAKTNGTILRRSIPEFLKLESPVKLEHIEIRNIPVDLNSSPNRIQAKMNIWEQKIAESTPNLFLQTIMQCTNPNLLLSTIVNNKQTKWEGDSLQNGLEHYLVLNPNAFECIVRANTHLNWKRKNKYGLMPLHLAIIRGTMNTWVEKLLLLQKQQNCEFTCSTSEGIVTPLEFAVIMGQSIQVWIKHKIFGLNRSQQEFYKLLSKNATALQEWEVFQKSNQSLSPIISPEKKNGNKLTQYRQLMGQKFNHMKLLALNCGGLVDLSEVALRIATEEECKIMSKSDLQVDTTHQDCLIVCGVVFQKERFSDILLSNISVPPPYML